MAVVQGRWAVILKETGEVIDIKLMDGTEPEINTDARSQYEVVEVDSDVKIGMVRGGPVNSVGGFGLPDGVEPTSAPVDEDTKAVSHAKQRGTGEPDKAEETEKPAEPVAKTEATPARKGKRKAA